MNSKIDKFFYKSQREWIQDDSPLKIVVKSRQTGFSWINSYRFVRLVSARGARLDAYISSRDENQAALQIQDCRNWAKLLQIGFTDLGEVLLGRDSGSAHVLQFANGRRIYSLSSNPNALAGKRGHVTLDEFALHQDQRLLYRVAKPVTTWGGQLSIISTHRGAGTLFNQLIRNITENGNPMGWSFHCVPVQKAVDEGIVERINRKTNRNESRRGFLARLRAECIDEEQWLQEYCCIPADENAAFFSYEMLDACTDPCLRLMSLEELLRHAAGPPLPSDGRGIKGEGTYSQLSTLNSQLFLGMDIARKRNLCVIDIGEKIGSVVYDRLRIELQNQSFSEIESKLYSLLRLPQLKRACIDESGMGIQLAEQARQRFGWKVEPINFTQPLKEELAFALRRDFEDAHVRIPNDDKLRSDLRSLKKELTPSGKLRFIGETDDGHCDRTWAKALRQHAARHRVSAGAILI